MHDQELGRTQPAPATATIAYTGDVTALSVAQGGDPSNALVLVGIGSQLHVYVLPSGKQLLCKAVLPYGIRIHGISAMECGQAGKRGLLLAVHGDRHVAVLLLDPRACTLVPACQLPRFYQWTMAVQLSAVPCSSGGGGEGGEGGASGSSPPQAALVAVGLSDNSLEAFLVHVPPGPPTSSGIDILDNNSIQGAASTCLPSGTLGSPDAAANLAGGWGRGAGGAKRAQRLLRVESAERCLLYSMSLYPQPQPDGRVAYRVAAGTIFLDVVVWDTPAIPLANSLGGTRTKNGQGVAWPGMEGDSPLEAPSSFRLKGHTGSIHRVRWSPDGLQLASASDDRTVRVWDIPAGAATAGTGAGAAAAAGVQAAAAQVPAGAGAGAAVQALTAADGAADQPGQQGQQQQPQQQPQPSGHGDLALLQPRHVLFGHHARLWDCAWGRGLLVSASEDCSCKFWDLATGQLCGTIEGHRGRGIWQCALHGSLLLTGGADSSVKCWHLPDWLPPAALQALAGPPLDSPPDAALSGNDSGTSGGGNVVVAVQQGERGGSGQSGHGQQLGESLSLLLALPSPSACAPGRAFSARHSVRSTAEQACTVGGHTAEASRTAAAGGPGNGGSCASGGGGGESDGVDGCFGAIEKKKRGSKGVQTDSKGEWVRCLAMLGQEQLYVATNRGLIHRVQLPGPANSWEERWEVLHVSARPGPLHSLALAAEPPLGDSSGSSSSGGAKSGPGSSNTGDIAHCSRSSSTSSEGASATCSSSNSGGGSSGRGEGWHWVGACDMQGSALVLRLPAPAGVAGAQGGLEGMQRWMWEPYGGGAALGIFFAPKLGAHLAFTAGLEGGLTLWALPSPPSSSSTAAPSQPLAASGQVGGEQAAGPPASPGGSLGAHREEAAAGAGSAAGAGTAAGAAGQAGTASAEGVARGSAAGAACAAGAAAGDIPPCATPVKLAEVHSPKGLRLITLDATPSPGLVVCGDGSGNAVAWSLDMDALQRALWRLGLPCDGSCASAAALQPGAKQAEQQQEDEAQEGLSQLEANGTRGAEGGQGASEASREAASMLRLLGVAPEAHDNTPLRMLRIETSCGRLPPPLLSGVGWAAAAASAAAQDRAQQQQKGQQGQQLSHSMPSVRGVHIVTAGGDARVKRFVLPAGEAGPEGTVPELICVREERFHSVATIDGDLEPAASPPCPEEDGQASSGRSGEGGGMGGGGSMDGPGRLLHGFQATDYVVLSAAHDCEAVRVPCGGWRRPSAACVAGLDNLTVCFTRDAELHMYRRRTAPDAPPLPPRALHPAHHAKEAHAILLLPQPPNPTPPGAGSGSGSGASGKAPPPPLLACVTASEDATLRQLLACVTASEEATLCQLLATGGCAAAAAHAGDSMGGAFVAAGPLGDHAVGTAVKAVSLVPTGAGSWLLVTGGAKEVLMAWRLGWNPAGGLAAEWVSTRPPPRLGARPKTAAQGKPSKEGDLRIMALSAFALHPSSPPSTPSTLLTRPSEGIPHSSEGASASVGPPATVPSPAIVFAAVAASDASLALMACHLALHGRRAKRAWQTMGTLRGHASPVLCTAHLELPPHTPAVQGAEEGARAGVLVLPAAASSTAAQHSRHVMLSGATDGSMALWELGRAAQEYTAACCASEGATGAAGAAGPPAEVACAPVELQPDLWMEGVHQSGVNAVAAAHIGPDLMLAVTGGDDQALCAFLLSYPSACGPSAQARPQVLAQRRLPNAHSSAVKGVWTDGRMVFSVGLDQRVRAWRVDAMGPELEGQLTKQPQQEQLLQVGGGPSSQAAGRQQEGVAAVAVSPAAGAGTDLGPNGAQGGQIERLGEFLNWEEGVIEGPLCGEELGPEGIGEGSSGWRVELQESGCLKTQVLEPAAIDVVPAAAAATTAAADAGAAAAVGTGPTATLQSAGCRPREAVYLVGVAGRGTELLRWQC